MKDKKRFISFAVMAGLLVVLLFTIIFVPIVNVETHNMGTGVLIPEASGTFSLFTFTKSLLYFVDCSYDADGPVWLSILGVALNWLIVIGAVILLGFVVFELCTANKENLTLKKNATAKKLALAVGYFAASVFVFELVAFIVTTAMAQGYFVYTAHVQAYLTAVLSVGILVCSYLSCKKDAKDQKPNKARDGVGFAVAGVFAVLFVGLVYAPQMVDGFSFWDMSMQASSFIGQPPIAAEYFVGIGLYATIAMGILALFVFVYSLVGFIRCMCGKSTNWLSGAVKRWSMAFLVCSFVYLFLMMATIIVEYGCFEFEGTYLITLLPVVMLMLPYVPYLMSTTISHNKAKKEKQAKDNA